MAFETPSRPTRLQRSDAPTVFWHAALLLFMLLAFSTGLRIALDNAKGGWRAALEPLLLQGDVVRWHAWAALALAALVGGYLAFLTAAALSARWRVSRQLLQVRNPKVRWQSINRLLYWVGLVLFLSATLSGAWLYFLPFWGFVALATQIHEWSCWALIAYVLLHILAQFKLGGLWQLLKVFVPRRDYAQAGAAMAAVGLAAAAGAWGLDWSATRRFEAPSVAQPPVVDGVPDDAAWQAAPPIVVNTSHGWDVAGGETRIEARAVLHGERIYILAQWNDDSRSFMRTPLQKTAKGWVRLIGDDPVANNANADTIDYYEDKFAIAISPRNSPFGQGWQFGPDPLPGLPKPLQGRGYHFTQDGSVVDLWHWKASRTGPLGQAEDSHFGAPVAFDPQKHQKRYPAGYGADRKEGGYKDNFKPLPDGGVQPLYLPKDPQALFARLGGTAPSPTASHGSAYNLAMDEVVPYSAERDTLPIGAIIPSHYFEGRMRGPAGDVDAVASWADGRWRIEFSRRLDTQDPEDVPITDGVYLWFAAFNHNQTRHSWHAVPVQLRLVGRRS